MLEFHCTRDGKGRVGRRRGRGGEEKTTITLSSLALSAEQRLHLPFLLPSPPPPSSKNSITSRHSSTGQVGDEDELHLQTQFGMFWGEPFEGKRRASLQKMETRKERNDSIYSSARPNSLTSHYFYNG